MQAMQANKIAGAPMKSLLFEPGFENANLQKKGERSQYDICQTGRSKRNWQFKKELAVRKEWLPGRRAQSWGAHPHR
jgi:hypothetical protein